MQLTVSLTSVYESHLALEELKRKAFKLGKEYGTLTHAPGMPAFDSTMEERQNLTAQSRDWLQEFNGKLSRPTIVDLNKEEIDGLPFIRFQHKMLDIYLQTLYCPDELGYDEFLD